MASDPYEKTQRLIERALHESTPEHEARNAAMAACQLIAKHGLLRKPRTNKKVDPFAELFSDFAAPARPPPQHKVAPTPPPPVPKQEREAWRQVLVPDVSTYCLACAKRITRGTYAIWSACNFFHVGCYHMEP